MTDQRCPYNRRHALGEIKAARLIVEMIAPACSPVTGRLMVDQPLQWRTSALSAQERSPVESCRRIKPRARNPMPFVEWPLGTPRIGRRFKGNRRTPCCRTVRRKFVLEGQRTNEPGVQTVERVVALVVVLFQPTRESGNGFVDAAFRIRVPGNPRGWFRSNYSRTCHACS